ncbi:hypothetical protein HDV00_002686 [Rhizophlyctis rosea]|nr:hypothetical protein HDV00_002686 [Rhizophlyctis rosea]
MFDTTRENAWKVLVEEGGCDPIVLEHGNAEGPCECRAMRCEFALTGSDEEVESLFGYYEEEDGDQDMGEENVKDGDQNLDEEHVIPPCDHACIGRTWDGTL